MARSPHFNADIVMALYFNLLKPFMLFSKFMFLFPHRGYWKICDSWRLYSTIVYPCFVCLQITTIYYLLVTGYFNIYAQVLVAFSSFIHILATGSHFTSFLFRKESIDNILESIGHLYKKNYKCFSININFWTLVAFILFLIDVHTYTRIYTDGGSWCVVPMPYVYLVMYTILMQFVYFLDFLRVNFKALTGSIGNTESKLLKQIEEHWHLIELCHDVNELYSKQLLFGMFRLFMTLTLDAFFIVSTLTKYSSDPNIFSIVYPSMTNSTWSLVMLLAITHTSELTKEAADSFHAALSDVLRKNKTINNEMLVLYLHMKPTVNLNADGFFSIGRHAISSVLAVVVTFLVILIQISNT